jgi:hypothetical protein
MTSPTTLSSSSTAKPKIDAMSSRGQIWRPRRKSASSSRGLRRRRCRTPSMINGAAPLVALI